jgi:hypothetical protein
MLRTASAVLGMIAIIALLSACVPIQGWEWGEVNGRVTDQTTGEGLGGAEIMVRPLGTSTFLATGFTDSEGRFHVPERTKTIWFAPFPLDTYPPPLDLRIQAVGYEGAEVSTPCCRYPFLSVQLRRSQKVPLSSS